ncbi:23S rRNA (uracil(1939)-C(5))-methyltransferase RlmD [Legionella taurinensis]|uniref:23S rRNA (uracil(1939)-C(5))-methyltransferase RlmD n=1 Tax=Legionella taurinensis TaxID=70611 RepID=A0A3A5L7D5_9GAMM|nr:23S rRNA (uracil(1939)-C(5))-methyltransferase RlmD [Legionella taurinensis]MDX1838282.1 23S rRNA (uracil(1939)-C(5))-methyltransferase RlmD [Legionella taurinensis]PUT39228.1 23S rRNA (uracil(1939)-C(5))-methyltransferase RlmD [Legionella taurinensis]PUT40574.1 23S rRNA (uracil(1939)-C(5))-methyltransferase RlmD [Legionella taurinensis]PUT43994.1 23S rRNA (uracil(1939)-C(5))-methyltransferase RlmD [Legionella taurinensis]PUT46256.1 23S rRNA (uracil(1939)-C(5))-methyltransferase RlmD [Legio
MSRRKQRPPRTVQTAEIVNFSHDGRGIARLNGKTTFIQDALPGETVLFQYTRTKNDFDEGRALEILSPAANRVSPRCQHYSACGGCSLQHLDENAQIHEKQTLLLDLLRRIGKVEPESTLAPLSAGSWHYRNKARLSVRYVEKKQGTLVGFREKSNPRYIAEIEHCPVLNARVEEQIMPLRALIDSFDSPQSIAQVEVAAGDDEVALIFRNMTPLSETDKEALRRFGDASGFKLYLQPQGPDSVSLFYSPGDSEEYLHYQLPDEQVRFRFHPTDFTQVNAGLNRLMVRKALELMDVNAGDVVLDLFCGLGNFSLPLARRSKEVIGVEGSDTMVRRAAMNADYNGISNARFYCADLDQVDALAAIIRQPIDKMLIDPPRSGALEIVRQIDKLNPIRLVYVSCNPATLARDTDILVNHHGYRLRAVGVMDMFPHTAHVESIALFEKDKQ